MVFEDGSSEAEGGNVEGSVESVDGDDIEDAMEGVESGRERNTMADVDQSC